MKPAGTNFFSSMRDFLAKRFLIAAGAWLALAFIGARPIPAQTTNPVTGTAGFETGLQLLAAGIGTPVNPSPSGTGSGVTVVWGDGSSSMGLIQTRNSSVSYDVFGTHLYAQPGTYLVHIQYSYQPCDPGFLGFCTNPTVPVDLPTTAKITAPGNFVILSIGDSVASGEGNPNEPINVGTNYPGWSFWDDAYSSYEGYAFPSDVANEWGDPTFPCHRSGYAGPALAANTLVANNPGSDITFIHFACSGATIEPDDTPASAPPSGISSVGWVQDAVGQLKVARARLAKFGAGVDILLISAGSNSMYGPNSFGNGFGGLVKYCLKPNGIKPPSCSTNETLKNDLNNTFKELPAEYERLAMEINCQQPPPFLGVNFLRQADGNNGDVYQDPDPGCTDPQKQIPKLVLITEYMDPTHDQTGHFPTSNTIGPAFHFVKFPDDFAFFFYDVVLPLNSTVDLFPWYAQQAGLTVPVYPVVGIGGSGFNPTADDFLFYGVGAGEQKWVNSGNDSINLMGEGPAGYPGEQDCSFVNLISLGGCGTEQLNGMLHPNSAALDGFCRPHCGQDDYSDRIYGSTIQFNPPVTNASATVGGNSYAFGNWAHESVAVSLSASNSIQQAGVGPTYYAVDNSACGSSFAQQSNLANVPGCSVYIGPFTISNSGKHKVTFFSSNASGYPIISSASLLVPTNEPLVPPLEGILQSVQVWVNKEPPVMTCTAAPSVLWPPNNKMVPVRLNVTAVSALFGQTPFSLKSVTTSEGNVATDIQGFVIGQPSTAGSLLASRHGNEKTGRVYTFVYQSTDESGLTGTCTSTVTVPHGQGRPNR